MYTVYEMFYSLQGEGAQTGRPAIFCRFAGCNLWSGREQDRTTAVCDFCDTAFVGTGGQNGGKFANAQALVEAIRALWPSQDGQLLGPRPYVICTGGEPALQLDQTLVDALHQTGFEVAIETNGTRPLPAGLDWICVSPKADSELLITAGDELKLVYPQPKAQPERFCSLAFKHFYLQPMDGPMAANYTRRCVDYCLANPQWKLSLQTHKLLGID